MDTQNVINRIRDRIFFLYVLTTFFTTKITITLADEALDTREGEDVTLKCRFSEQDLNNNFLYYWARYTPPSKFDNVAVKDDPLNANYRIDFRPEQGVYDLRITNVSYSRDNGRFQCAIKARGTGADVYHEYYNVTVLTPPQSPQIWMEGRQHAVEDEKINLTCSSYGGSPDPDIVWYRQDNPSMPIDGMVSKHDLRTMSTLTLVPRREDDGVKYRCTVWNRAMMEHQRLESTIELSVNYYPRVEVGPENPLRVERDTPAKLECKVDAKPIVNNYRWNRGGRYVASTSTYVINRVSLGDAGKYTCTAENGIGKPGEQDILLDVLYPPIVVIESKTREAEERETINIRCNVTSNPPPVSIEWLKEGNPEFRYTGDVLTLRDVRAEHAGTYMCRAVNMMKPFNGKVSERVGNATIALLVRHRPGQAYINPSRPIVHVGSGVVLTCTANPPGWPVPQFKWFKDAEGEVNTQTILAQGSQYTIPRVHLGSEGKYHCHAANELGHGEMATIQLEVHQAPQFVTKLAPHVTNKVGLAGYEISCNAKGKPKPHTKWLKDGRELTSDGNLFDITTTSNNDNGNGMVTVTTKLSFRGKSRPNTSQLIPGDRGLYTCLFENEVGVANSSMHLRIEHEPIIMHEFNKVAFDIKENAKIICKVQAYPKPDFQWQQGTNTAPLPTNDNHHEITTISEANDIYTSTLSIRSVSHQDYAEYQCRVSNSMETIRAHIRLQQKGPPEEPSNLQAADVGPNYVTLLWDPGFDGGLQPKYFVSYRKVAVSHDDQVSGECGAMTSVSSEWLEFDCHRDIPCNVTPLEQHQSYVFKVKAMNTKGNSKYSSEIATTTKVSKIPSPIHVTFDPNSKVLTVNVGATCLALMAVVETVINEHSSMAAWQIVETIPLIVSGSIATSKEVVIEQLMPYDVRKSHSRSLSSGSMQDEDFTLPLEDDSDPKVRVKLCLKGQPDHCGEYSEAEIGSQYISPAGAFATPTVIGLAVSCIIFLLVVTLILMFCRCKRNQTKKSTQGKDYEMDSVRPSIVAQQNQAPPPYYPASGLDNKALEHSMDLVLALDDPKNVYATQNGYGYHPSQGLGIPGHTIPSQE